MYDLVIRGGEVVDPGSGRVGRFDVAVQDGRIAVVAPEINDDASETIDAAGQYVTPGLIDLHTHMYWGATYWGIEADPVCAATGVTTSVDAGSAGAYNWPAFRRFLIEPSQSRIVAFLNISSIGLVHNTHELANPAYPDVDLAIATVEENRDIIIGMKARIDGSTTGTQGTRPLALAREAADRLALPLMVHIGGGPPPLADILEFLRPGDILTHCFTGNTNRIVAGDPAQVREDVRAARQRGVLMDIGHGAGSFNYLTTEAALAEGFLPDVISSDIHQLSIQGPMFDMPTTLSKFLNLGLSMEQVIERATSAPARAIHMEDRIGTLAVGQTADIALFRIEEGDFTFYDISRNARKGTQKLESTRTIVGGRTMQREKQLFRRMIWANPPAASPQR
jgi:dihydroorotase